MSEAMPNRKGSIIKILTLCLGAFLLLIGVSTLLLPFFFSSAVGKKILLEKVRARTGVKVQIDALSLSWFGSQRAQGITGKKTADALSFTCEEISSDAPLWRLLLKNDIGHLEVKAPTVQLSKALHLSAYPNPRKIHSAGFVGAVPEVALSMPVFSVPLQGQVRVSEGKAEVASPGLEPIIFDQIRSIVDLTRRDRIALDLSCTTSSGAAQGQISVHAEASDLETPAPVYIAQATIQQLPVRGIDQLLSLVHSEWGGLLVNALGATIDLNCRLNAARANFDLSLNAKSPLAQAQISAQSKDGALSLKSPATLQFTLTEALLQKFSPLSSGLHLLQSAPMQLSIPQFSCPWTAEGPDLMRAAFQASASAPPQVMLTLGAEQFVLNGFNATANSSSLRTQVTLHGAGSVQTKERTGSIAVDGTLKVPADAIEGTLALNAAQFPVALLGLASPAPLPLALLLGPSADIQAVLNLSPKNPKCQFSWQSDLLKIPSLEVSLGDTWTLISPAHCTFVLSPGLFPVAQSTPIQGTLQNGILPIHNLQNAQMDALVEAGPLSLVGGAQPLVVSAMKAQISVRTLDQISMKITGDPFQASLMGALRLNTWEFILKKPFIAQYAKGNSTLQFSLDPTTLPLIGFSLDALELKGELSTPQLLVGPEGKEVSLQKVTLPFQYSGKAHTASFQASAQVPIPSGQAGNLQGSLKLSQFSLENGGNFAEALIQGSLNMQNLSTALLDATLAKPLSALIGPSLSAECTFQSAPGEQSFAVHGTSPLITANAAFAMSQGSRLQLQGVGNQITWTITPESYRVLDTLLTGTSKGPDPFELKETSTFTIALTQLTLPVAMQNQTGSLSDRIPQISSDLSAIRLKAKGGNPKLTIYDKSSQETIQLSGMSFSLEKQGTTAPFAFTLASAVTTQTGKPGIFSLDATLTPTLNAEGAFDLSKLTSSIDLKVQDFPSGALDIFARAQRRTDSPFTTLFGKTLNANVSLRLDQFTGPVSFQLNTPLARASLSGTVTNGTLTLSDTVYAQLKITKEMSHLVLKEVNPLDLSYLYSQDPVTLEIPANGFSLPLFPTNLAQAKIPDARIELGKIACHNEGNVNIALSLLKAKQFDKNSDLTLWFAPIDFSLQKGIVSIERTEILLADTFDICTWGTLDLVRDDVDMTLGLTAQTLSRAFGIKNLPQDYVLTLPMRGKLDNVQINTGKATAKIALLLAWQQKNLAGALGDSPGGALVGGLLNKMATLPDIGTKVPAAKHPFPWEAETPTKRKTSHDQGKKRKFKAKEKPLKQLLKVIR